MAAYFEKLLSDIPQEGINILDSPPGTSCNVVNTCIMLIEQF